MQDKKSYSQWRAMLAITRASFTATLRSPSAVIFTLFFPLVFISVFGFIGGGALRISVAAEEGTDTTTSVYQALRKVPAVNIIHGKTNAEITEALKKGKLDAGIYTGHVHAKIACWEEVNIRTSAASPVNGNVLKQMVESIAYRQGLIGRNALPEENQVVIEASEVQGRKSNMIDFILPGQLGFSLLSTGVFGTAFVFLSLRQTLVIKRFFATPVRRLYIILGEAVSRVLFGLLGALFLILIGHYVFGFTLINGVSTVLQMLLLSAIGLIIFMGFGFAISGIAKSESTVPPLANIVTLPQFLLAGTFFSIDVFPAWLQAIARILPLTYLNDALRRTAFDGASLMDVSSDLGILLLWGVGIYLFAARTFKWE